MPRANRHFLPGHIWHITHRCHQNGLLRWSEAIAVGSPAFVDDVTVEVQLKALQRDVAAVGRTYTLRGPTGDYVRSFGREGGALRPNNAVLWEENLEGAETWRGPTRGFPTKGASFDLDCGEVPI